MEIARARVYLLFSASDTIVNVPCFLILYIFWTFAIHISSHLLDIYIISEEREFLSALCSDCGWHVPGWVAVRQKQLTLPSSPYIHMYYRRRPYYIIPNQLLFSRPARVSGAVFLFSLSCVWLGIVVDWIFFFFFSPVHLIYPSRCCQVPSITRPKR